jgi:hypothetical protein
VPDSKNPFATLHIKLSRTAKSLKIWFKNLLSHCKLVMAICRKVVDQLERAQDVRQLAEAKRNLIKVLKARLLGLAAIEKCRVRQKSRVIWLKKRDANTKFFHIMANIRRKKNYIHTLHSSEGLAVFQAQKHDAIFNHFKLHIRTYLPRAYSLNFAELGWEPRNLSLLELPYTVDEIKKVNLDAPKEKAPGPDGFISIFFTSCWDIIKQDLCNDVQFFFLMNQ